MSGKYWIKLYHEILHDRKMVELDDRLWRRAIECFLLAGDIDEDGYLPSLDDIAFAFRSDREQLETELNELVMIGILEVIDTRYFVQKFAERQSPMPKAEYMRRKRRAEKAQEYYQDGTDNLPDSYQPVTNGNTEEIRGDKKREEELTSGDVMTLYANNISPLTQLVSEQLKEMIDTFSNQWVADAIKIAVKRNKRNLSYINGILRSWEANGKDDGGKKQIQYAEEY